MTKLHARSACNKRQLVAADIIYGTTRHSATALPQQLSMNRLLLLGCIAGSGSAFIAPPAAAAVSSRRVSQLHAAALAEDLDLKSWCEAAGIAADKFDVDSATVTQDVAALEVLARVPRSLTLSAARRKDWPGKLTAARSSRGRAEIWSYVRSCQRGGRRRATTWRRDKETVAPRTGFDNDFEIFKKPGRSAIRPPTASPSAKRAFAATATRRRRRGAQRGYAWRE